MTFDDKLNELINEVEVPDELSPKNIARMLKAQNAQSKMEAEHRNIKTAPTIAAQRRTIILRTAAATAACAVFAAGMIAFNSQNKDDGNIGEQIDYYAVSPDSYEELYNIYTGIYLDGTSPEDTETTQGSENTGTAEPISEKPDTPRETLADMSEYDFSGISDSRVAGADIVRTDGTNLYCINGNTLYIVSLETMEVVSQVENKLNPPVELYIDGDMLILVSKENEEIQVVGAASGITESADNVNGSDSSISRTNVVADIYDISDKADPVHTTTYKQNGSYTSSKLADGILYLVSSYRDYRNAPLDENMDLDSYVPAYYVGGEKKYVAAGDIIVPANANSTDYTVLSAIDLSSGSATVKAVLGSSRNVYCSAGTLYIAGVGKSKDNEDYSVISSFDLSGSGMTYKASASVAGRVINRSMNEYNGLFRIAAESTGENGTYTSVYVLDDSLKVVNSAGQLLSGQKTVFVRFEENYASLYTDESGAPAMVIDLSSNPPVQTQSLAGTSAYLYEYSADKLLGLGKDESGLTLTMYSADNGLALSRVSFAENMSDIDSKALKDRRALLIDSGNSLIGVPVYSHNEFGTKNLYYVFVYDEDSGFISKGVIEYNDLDDKCIFERAAVKGDKLYIVGGSRIVSVRVSDLKVIDSLEF